jgi:CDP-glucose 4,6-dehydratase
MLELLKKTYQGKKIFLTGHTGFKGAWLLKILHMLGAEVKGYALEPKTSQDIYFLLNGDSLCHSVISDLRNKERVIAEIKDFQPDFLFHLAAQPLVRLSYEFPSETFEVNAVGTAHVLDGMRAIEGKCHGVFITTDKVYHNYETDYPYKEDDRLGGYDPYSASKACAELVIDCYRNSFFNTKDFSRHQKSIAVARAGNVIGGGDWSKDRLVPDIVQALRSGNEIVVRNPDSVRPWQHVLEPLLGYLMLGSKLDANPASFSQAYNFGPYPGDTLTVKQLVESAIEVWGEGSYVIRKDPNAVHEAGLLKLDISKAIAETGWKPRIEARDSVDLTIEWYKQYYRQKDDIDRFTELQIMKFLGDE